MIFEALGLECRESSQVLCGIHYAAVNIALYWVISVVVSLVGFFKTEPKISTDDL